MAAEKAILCVICEELSEPHEVGINVFNTLYVTDSICSFNKLYFLSHF